MALLVADSYREVLGAPPFMPWLEKAYAKAFSEPLEAALARQKEPLAAARWAFTLVKRSSRTSASRRATSSPTPP
jgi:hypothetical protein